MIKASDTLLAVSSSIEGMIWYRFPLYIQPSYFYMSETSWDALDILPQQNMYFLGFLFYMNRDKKAFKLTWSGLVDNVPMQNDTEIEMTDDMGTEFQGPDGKAAKYVKVFFDEPLQLTTSSKVTLKSKVKCEEANRHFYGYDGYDNYIEKIEG